MLAAVAVAAGCLLIVAGVALWSPRTAVVTAGIMLAAAGVLFVDVEDR